ncbi:hypothetical protein MPSEU_000161500 [Mayamaea pseudoterrestris]|nr:hypothetical protein MPSEU_000161500 [Mayamaea pseudoterrestris]
MNHSNNLMLRQTGGSVRDDDETSDEESQDDNNDDGDDDDDETDNSHARMDVYLKSVMSGSLAIVNGYMCVYYNAGSPDILSALRNTAFNEREVAAIEKTSSSIMPTPESVATALAQVATGHDITANALGSVWRVTVEPTPMQLLPSFPSNANSSIFDALWPAQHTLYYRAPESLSPPRPFAMTLTSPKSPDDTCAFCQDLLTQKLIGKMVTCGHMFHYPCLMHAESYSNKCPFRCVNVPMQQGTMPSGYMTVSSECISCCGHGQGTFVVRYSIYDGKQKCYHPNPGLEFSGANYKTYLPDNDQGRDLLKRLECAFVRGLTFAIVSAAPNDTITWATIPHKTSLSGGGERGFPDQSFFADCNIKLDDLNVPIASAL